MDYMDPAITAASPADKLRRIIDLLDDPDFGDLDTRDIQKAEYHLGRLLDQADDDADLRHIAKLPPITTQARQLDAALWDAAKWEGRL